MALFGNNKQNFEITDGHDTFQILQERTFSGAIKTPFKTVWQVEKNGKKLEYSALKWDLNLLCSSKVIKEIY